LTNFIFEVSALLLLPLPWLAELPAEAPPEAAEVAGVLPPEVPPAELVLLPLEPHAVRPVAAAKTNAAVAKSFFRILFSLAPVCGTPPGLLSGIQTDTYLRCADLI
jgi:hypothetical protein